MKHRVPAVAAVLAVALGGFLSVEDEVARGNVDALVAYLSTLKSPGR